MPRELLQKRPVKFILEMVDLYFSKHISRSAAELAYFLILSFFPLLICINALSACCQWTWQSCSLPLPSAAQRHL